LLNETTTAFDGVQDMLFEVPITNI